MRLFFLFKNVVWFGIIVWTNTLIASPCTVYYYTSSCIDGAPLHGLAFESSVKYRLGKSDAKFKIRLEPKDQLCKGPKGGGKEPNDPPPVNSEGQTFITSEAYSDQSTPDSPLRIKYVLLRSTQGKLQTILDGGWTTQPNEALDSLYAAISSRASCFSQDGLVRLNSEPGPGTLDRQSTSNLAINGKMPDPEIPQLSTLSSADASATCVEQGAQAAKNRGSFDLVYSRCMDSITSCADKSRFQKQATKKGRSGAN